MMQTIQLIEFLYSNGDLRENFNDDEIISLAKHLNINSVESGTVIRSQGAPDCTLMIVITGEVILSTDGIEIDKLGAGQIFGEGSFSDLGSSYSEVVAVEDSTLAELGYQEFEALLKHEPKHALKFKQYFKQIHEQRVHEVEGLSFVDTRRYFALVAHNEMKPSLVDFAKSHTDKLRRFHLIATGTTGIKLFQETGLMLSRKVASGPLGGDQAIGKLISENSIVGMIFFRDPLSAHPHHADIEALGRLCDVYQVPFATNPGGALAILNHLLIDHPEETVIPNRVLEHYKNQQKQIVA